MKFNTIPKSCLRINVNSDIFESHIKILELWVGKMKKYIVLFFTIVLILSIGAVVSADTTVIDLVAGQNEVIGNVTVEQVGDDLVVTYNITVAGWCLTTTHLYVGSEPAQRHSPGRFPYKHENLDCVTVDVFTISDIDGDTVYIAAHADASFSTDNDTIPLGDGTVQYTLNGTDLDSYFDNTINGAVDGTFNGWCVDVERAIFLGADYDGTTYSTLSDFPTDLVDRPENMDLINYIINQDYFEQGMSYGDIQLAIWTLIDDTTTYPGAYTQANVDAIVADALANGEGFVPSCGDVVAIIVEPTVEAQTTIIEYPVPCVTGGNRAETAWALAEEGIAFRQGWGSYFEIQLSANDSTSTTDTTNTGSSLTDLIENVDIVTVDAATTAASSDIPASSANSGGDSSTENDKVQVCHAAGQSGNWVQLEISINGLNGFFLEDGTPRNGLDYIGQCSG